MGMSTICDHVGCGEPAKRIAVEVSCWRNRPTFKDEIEDIEVTEFSADLCKRHAGRVLIYLSAGMTERVDE